MPGTRVYIDGFNLYYGTVKGTGQKWLDLEALARGLLRGHTVDAVKYFTARVHDRDEDLGQSQRQDTYLRALSSRPSIEIHFGQFRTNKDMVRLVKPFVVDGKEIRSVRAYITEEKGSDVNLASHLLWDAAHNEIEAALVISNDSDLQTPVTMAMELGVPVLVANPHRHNGQKDHLHGSDRRNIRRGHLERAQFPEVVFDSEGREVRRPKSWA